MIPIYPMKVYLFDENGKYTEPIILDNESQLNGVGTRTILQSHIKQGLEVRITDPFDNCLFHADKGKIIFPI